ncbi:dehydrogenase-like protein [Xylariales sp. PMI_506]|nr:dehydrogenase-like protein [Xylariales sp. PMI_506]
MASTNIPTEQLAQVVEKFGTHVNLKKVPVAKPAADEILVNVKYSGVCHSDVHAMKGDWVMPPTKLPLVGGHEGVGVVVAKGDLVTNFELGDYAGVKWINGVCANCSFCQGGHEELCADARLGGYTVDGSFQQYAIVKANAGNKIPKDVDLAAVAPIMCAGLTVYKGLKITEARPGQYVAIVGAGGGLGFFGLQYARAMGLIPIAIDGGAEKGKVCKEHGAEHYVDIETSKNVIQDLRKLTPDGLGPHAAVIVASEEEPFSHASEYVRPLGTVAIVGIPADGYIKSQIWDTIVRMVTLRGSLVGNRIDTDEAIEFYRRGLIKVPYKVVGLSKLDETLKLLDHSEVIGRYVVDTSR